MRTARRRRGRSRAMMAGAAGCAAVLLSTGAALAAGNMEGRSGGDTDWYQQRVNELAQELASVPANPLEIERGEAGQANGGAAGGSSQAPQSGDETLASEAPQDAMQNGGDGGELGPAARAVVPMAQVAGRIVGPVDGGPLTHGLGYEWFFPVAGSPEHWLGAFDVAGTAQWCVDFASTAPTGATTSASLSPSQIPAVVAGASAYQLADNAQAGFVIGKYGTQADPGVRAATSVLVHLNYELGEGRKHLGDLLQTLHDPAAAGTAGPIIAEMARTMAADARANTPLHSASAELVAQANKQQFQVTGIGIKQLPKGNWIGGVDVSVTLTQPTARFDESGLVNGTLSQDGRTWTGKTTTAPLVLNGRSTANGKIAAEVSFGAVKESLGVYGFERPNGSQSTLQFAQGIETPTLPPTQPVVLVRDFQPMLVSSTADANSRLVEAGTTLLKDRLTVMADPAHPNPHWLGVGGTFPGETGYIPLPVEFVGNAYFTADRPPALSREAPADAELIGTTSFIADGPGEYSAQISTSQTGGGAMPGFITWVWSMTAANQQRIAPEDRYMLAADWKDDYAMSDELTSVRHKGKIASSLTVKSAIDGTYMVDDVWVSGLPKDHPEFPGAQGFVPDRKTIEQRLYFWPQGKTVQDIGDARQIGKTLTLPAANGFYPSQGDPSWRVQQGEDGRPLRGTYQVVHSFEGDDRAMPFATAIPDQTEQFTVTGEPQIATTATGAQGSKVVEATKTAIINDRVCYLDLVPGREYRLAGTLMHQESGQPVVSGGKKVTSERIFTPEAADGCTNMVFRFDSRSLASTSVVVFEDLWLGKKVVATHAELTDRGQTIQIGPEELARTGAVGFWAVAAASVLSVGTGAVLLVASRRRATRA